MDREQLIRDLRKIQDDEYMRFGDVGDQTHGKAADMLEHDDVVIRALETAVETSRKTGAALRKLHRRQLLILLALNVTSQLAFAAFVTAVLVKNKVWTWPLF